MFLYSPLDQFFVSTLPDNVFFFFKFFIYINISNVGYFSFLILFLIILFLDIMFYNLICFISILGIICILWFTTLQSLLSITDSDIFNFFFVWFATLVSLLFFFNLSGLLPYGFTLTSHLIVSLTFSSIFFLWINFVYFCRFSFLGFGAFVPAGSPTSILLLIVPIEVISYVSRILSLAIRLFANMMAGHTLLHILSAFLYGAISLNIFLSFPLILLNMIFIMELGVALLQIYVFTVLCYLYVQDTFSCAH